MPGEYLFLSAKSFPFTGRLCSSNNSKVVDLVAEGRMPEQLPFFQKQINNS